jgi:4-amino-4-deoxychorismate lyase
MRMKILTKSDVFQVLEGLNPKRKYAAMYSSLFGGVVTDPALMIVPIDDHQVHRGDAVFEAIRFTDKGIYLLTPHLERLYRSAEMISLKLPIEINGLQLLCEELVQIVKGELKLSGEGILRMFVSRGPGDFSPNPYTTLGTQIYIVATDFKSMPKEKYEQGVSLMISKIPVKQSPYATVKSCNYLPNVLMKKESVDQGYDFSIGVTPEGFIAEGPTENIMMLSEKNELLAPKFDYTLKGTTLVRTLKLAEALKAAGKIKDIRIQDISLMDLKKAREVMMVGTTLSVLPVTKFESAKVGDGVPGPVTQELNKIVNADMGAHTN